MRNAKSADKHILYQISVQNAPFEAKFIQRVYKKFRGRQPLRLKEDFCGTALLCCEWAQQVKKGRALGADLHRPTLDWGQKNNLAPLPAAAQKRVELREADVLDASGFKPDVSVAFNFSYFIFKERSLLLQYFRRVYKDLADDGVFLLDIYGGAEAQRVQEETTEQDGFDYVWNQAKYNPITGDYLCHIHFEFPDGSRRHRAFTYDWRLWSLQEVNDLLVEAGFEAPTVFWEGTDKEGEGNGIFRPSTKGDDSVAWVSYIAAPK